MKTGANYQWLTPYEWLEIFPEYEVIRTASVAGIARLGGRCYFASVAPDRGGSLTGGDIGRAGTLADAKRLVEQWLVQNGQATVHLRTQRDGRICRKLVSPLTLPRPKMTL